MPHDQLYLLHPVVDADAIAAWSLPLAGRPLKIENREGRKTLGLMLRPHLAVGTVAELTLTRRWGRF